MTAPITLHQLPGSPNNIKVRIALNYKGISWTSAPFSLDGPLPGNRTKLVELSCQPFTPVLRHGETVVFDSGSILRYLEANFPDTKPIFSTDYGRMREIETWELACKTEIGPSIGAIFGQVFVPEPDFGVCEEATRLIQEKTACYEEKLSASPYLMGSELTAADIVTVPFVNLAMIEPSPDEGPIYAFFRENLHLGEGRDSVRAWVRRVMELA